MVSSTFTIIREVICFRVGRGVSPARGMCYHDEPIKRRGGDAAADLEVAFQIISTTQRRPVEYATLRPIPRNPFTQR